MRPAPFAILCAALLAGCAAQGLQEESKNELRVRYACANGEEVEMRFFPSQKLGILSRGGTSLELPQRPSGSGFIYSNGPNTVRGKGSEISVEIGRMVPIKCQALE